MRGDRGDESPVVMLARKCEQCVERGAPCCTTRACVPHRLQVRVDPREDRSWLQSNPEVRRSLGHGQEAGRVQLRKGVRPDTNVPPRVAAVQPWLLGSRAAHALYRTLHLTPHTAHFVPRRPPRPCNQVFTDSCHALDRVGPNAAASPECLSEGVKRLKQRLLQRIIDTMKMEQ